MKLAIEAEDSIIGIICGLLLLGLSGTFFIFKLNNIAYAAAFIIFAIFIVLDFINEIRWLASYFKIVVFSMLHNLIALGISLAFISRFTGWSIPYITSTIVPYLQSEQIIGWIGMFLVVTNTLWLVTMPFWS